MKTVTKILGAATIAGAAMLALSAPASAQVSVGIGLGGGYYAERPYSSCDPYSRFYDPYRCGPAYYPSYYGPSYYGPSYYSYGGPSIVIGGRFGGGFGGGFHGGGRGGWHGGGGHHR